MRAWLSLVCRKLCAGACEVRNRVMRGGACCKVVVRLRARVRGCLSQKRCKAEFAPGATEDANGGLEGQKWQE